MRTKDKYFSEILAQGARRLCSTEERKDLSIWPKYRLQREEEFEKLRKNECPDRNEENQESVFVGESSIKENVIDCGQCF